MGGTSIIVKQPQKKAIAALLLALLAVLPSLFTNLSKVMAAGLTVNIVTGYNFIVDSNVLSPSTYAPQAATIGAEVCNTSGSTITDVMIFVGDYTGGGGLMGTPGIYPETNTATDPRYVGTPLASATTGPLNGDTTFQLTHEGGSAGTTDATRYFGTLAPGECAMQYWLVSYPNIVYATGTGNAVPAWGAANNPDDDLRLSYDVWATGSGGTSGNASQTATMRNEISAAANKIWPNGDNKVPDAYKTAIDKLLGWDTITPSGTSSAYPGEVVSTQGIWYDLGAVGKGFDNNGDGIPDYNAWLQPIGDPGAYDPGCFRLVRTYGIIIVKLNDGTEKLIPFENQLYFENIPPNNTGVVGLVYYEYAALDGACTSGLSPYQEVASGMDNEKFSGDYGAGIPPLQTVAPATELLKSASPSPVAPGGTLLYTITFENNAENLATPGTWGVSIGAPDYGMPLIIEDMIPTGTVYDSTYTPTLRNPGGTLLTEGTHYDLLYYDKTTSLWTGAKPALDSNIGGLRWVFLSPVTSTNPTPDQLWTATYRTTVPGGYTAPLVTNTVTSKIGDGPAFDEHTISTLVTGPYSLSGTVYQDDGAGVGDVLGNALKDSATETGIADITVKLYYDGNGDGDYNDPVDFLLTTTSTGAGGTYSFGSLPAGNYITVVDTADPQLPTGYGATTPTTRKAALSAGTPSVTGLDYGFAPALSVDKVLSSVNPTTDGSTVTYTLKVSNNLPGSGTSSATCTYNIWSSVTHPTTGVTPPGGGPSNAQWYNVGGVNGSGNYVIGRPDGLDAYTNMSDNTDLLGLSGFNLGNQGGTITKVEYLIYATETADFQTNDHFYVHVYNGDAIPVGGTYDYNNVYFTTGSFGADYVIRQDITALRAWTWSDFATNLTELQLEANKGGGTTGNLSVDAVALVVTTNQSCGNDSTILDPVPLTDTFNTAELTYASSSLAPSSVSGGTITWNNVGPLYPGQTKLITVTFTAINGSGTSITTTNTESSSGARFASGTNANSATDNASVTITPGGSISGIIYSDIDNDGWQGTTGYESGTDDFIPNVQLTLYGCYTANPASGGTLITSPTTNKTCASQSGSSGWFAVPGKVTTTDANGAYSFTNLQPGYYYTGITGGTTLTTQRGEPIQNGASNGQTCTGAGCDLVWQPATGTVATADLNTTNFNSLTAGEDIANVSFGFNTPPMIFGNVFNDYNGNGTKGTGESGIGNGSTYVRVYLQDCGTDGICGNGDDGATVSTFTDANGNYTFTGLTGGGTRDYRVYTDTSTLPGGAAAWTQTGESDGSTNNSILITNIGSGVTSGSHDFGYQQSGTLTIGDTLFYDWDGDGTQDAGVDGGIPNVEVKLYVDLNGNGIIDATDPVRATSSTSSTGTYSFPNLPNGNYIVQVNTGDPDFKATSLSQTKDPSETGVCSTCDNQSSVTLAGVNNLTQDFGYQPNGSGSIGDLVWLDKDASGTQNGATETGIAGVTVYLYYDQDGDGVVEPGGDDLGPVMTTVTDADGKYLFENLIDGKYQAVIATTDTALPKDAFGNPIQPTTGTWDKVGNTVTQAATITGGNTVLTSDFGFTQLGAVGDSVYWDIDQDGQQDWSETGLSGVTVTLYACKNGSGNIIDIDTFIDVDNDGKLECSEQAGGYTFQLVGTTTTDASGHYLFSGLMPGQYKVAVTPPGGGTLTGDPDVIDWNNNNVYSCADTTAAPGYPAGDYQVGTCDSTHTFNIYPGTIYPSADFGYNVTANAVGDQLWIDLDGDGKVDVNEDANGNGVLDIGEDIDGDSKLDTAEVGISGATVYLCSALPCNAANPGNIVNTTTTDADGTYLFTTTSGGTALTNGNYYVAVSSTTLPTGLTNTYDKDGNKNNETSVTLSGSPVRDLDFGYGTGGTYTLSGTVCKDLTADGNCNDGETVLYAGITIHLYDQATGVYLGSTITGANGNYSFSGLDAGSYTVSMNASQLPLTQPQATTTSASPGLATVSKTTDPVTGETVTIQQTLTISGNTSGIDFAFTTSVTVDYGDLPVTYLSSGLSTGRNTIGTLYLGGSVDGETTSQPSPTAIGDGADENGVVPNTPADNWSTATGGSVNVTVTGGSGWLIAWMDFNGNGVFDASEKIIDQAVPAGTTTLNFSVPIAPNNPTTVNARFRLLASSPLFSSLAYADVATNGEVEDYQYLGVGTTPVSLAFFKTTRNNGTTRFEWATTQETGNIGFNLYALQNDRMVQLNDELIPSPVINSLEPQTYTYYHRGNSSSEIFFVEDIDILGNTRLHGPYNLDEAYGARPVVEAIDWATIQAESTQKAETRAAEGRAAAAHASARAQEVLAALNAGQNPGNGGSSQCSSSTGSIRGKVAPGIGAPQTPEDIERKKWCNGEMTGQNSSALALAEKYKVTYAEIMAWYCKGFGFGEIDIAYDLSQQSGVAVDEIFAMRESGLGWGQIKKLLGLNGGGTSTPPPTGTPIPPTETPAPPTGTSIPPTGTPVTPTGTTVPPTGTPVAPTKTPTGTTVPPTGTPVTPTEAPTGTTVPPTGVPATPTEVPCPPATSPKYSTELRFPVLDIRVDKSGLHQLTYLDLYEQGLDLNGVPSGWIAITNRGKSIPVWVSGNGKFGPGDSIIFYGEALDTLYTTTNIYKLQINPKLATAVTADQAKPRKGTQAATSYWETITLEENLAYASFSPIDDPWTGAFMFTYTTPKSWTYQLPVDYYDGGTAQLTIDVYGVTAWPEIHGDHHLITSFNGVQVDDRVFDDQEYQSFTITLPAGSVREGNNQLTFTVPGDTGAKWETIAFEQASLRYAREFVAENGYLSFTSAAGTLQVNNLPGVDVVVYRQDASGTAMLSGVEVVQNGSSYSARFQGTGSAATYVVASTDSLLSPAALAPERPEVDITSGQSNFLMIAHPDFIDGLAPLVAAREAQGYTVRVVNVEDVYAQFGGGIFDPQAIRDYIQYGVNNMGVEYVLLVGGDSYDYHNYVTPQALSFIPTPYVSNGNLVTYSPADPLLADVDGDRVPDVPLGRFPVRTSAELAAVVNKTLQYQNKDYGQTAVFSADLKDGSVNFSAYSNSFIDSLPAGWDVTRAYMDNGTAAARTTLISQMNEGVALTSFFGHSSFNRWTFKGLLNIRDIPALTNVGRPTVVIQFGCWNTYYVSPQYNTMGHVFLLTDNRGAAAIMGASTLTYASHEARLGNLIMPRLVQPGMTIGDAMTQAKQEMAASTPYAVDVILGWTILGDPTVVIVP